MLNLKNLFTMMLNKLCFPSGFTMEGELKRSDGKVVIGSGQIQGSNTVNMTMDTFVAAVRMTSGCSGSFNLSSNYTYSGVTVPNGWYNYLYLPHRDGAKNGVARTESGVTDNHLYGTAILMPMTVTTFYPFFVTIANGNIAGIFFEQNPEPTATTTTITTKNNTTNYENYQTIVTKRGKFVTVSFEIRTISVAKWPNVYPVTGLPPTYDGKEVYGSLLGPHGQSVSVAIQSDGSVKMGGGVNGITCYGTVTYIAA